MKQGLNEPCFFITCLSNKTNRVVGSRYQLQTVFNVVYLPKKSNEEYKDCHEVSERITDCLELITVDKELIRVKNLNNEVRDGVLQISFNVDLFLMKITEKEVMNSLISNAIIKK